MRLIAKQLTGWFNIMLILTMVGGMLPPAPLALASSPEHASSAGRYTPSLVSSAQPGVERESVPPNSRGSHTPTFPLPFNFKPEMGPLSPGLPPASSPGDPAAAPDQAAPASHSGLLFIENVGQFDPQARFMMRGSIGMLYLTKNALWFTLLERTEPLTYPHKFKAAKNRNELHPQPKHGVNLKLSFPGANPQARLEPFHRLETHVSYFTGSDPAKQYSDVPVWGGVRYVDFYPDVDLELTGEQGRLAWRLVGRNQEPATFGPTVRLRIQGADALTLEGEDIHLTTRVGNFALPLLSLVTADGTPVALPDTQPEIKGQVISAPFKPAATASLLLSSPHLAAPLPLPGMFFQQGSTDLLYANYLGGGDSDSGRAIAVDGTGNTYVTGLTSSANFTTTVGAFDVSCGSDGNCNFDGSYYSEDAFVAKVNSDGTSLIYATFLGGSDEDYGNDIVVDGTGSAYVTGITYSNNLFPATVPGWRQSHNGGDTDAFVVKLNADGTDLIYASYLGGSGSDQGEGIALDSTANVYVTGGSYSSDFFLSTVPGYDKSYAGTGDAYIIKLDAAGTNPLYHTYLGEDSYSTAIAVDGAGNAYVTGYAGSANFPLKDAFDPSWSGGGDAFVVKVEAGGTSLGYASFLGGSSADDYGYGIALDSLGQAYVTGWTENSPDFFPPTVTGFDLTNSPGAWDAYVAKVNPNGTALLYGTFVGGSGTDWARAITIDGAGHAYVTGLTQSADLIPAGVNGDDTSYNGTGDAYIVKVAADGMRFVYATYLPGSDGDEGFDIAVDNTGNAYVTGRTSSSDFSPAGVNGFDKSLDGFQDAFVAKLRTGTSGSPDLAVTILNSPYQPAEGETIEIQVEIASLSGAINQTVPFRFEYSLYELTPGQTQGAMVQLTSQWVLTATHDLNIPLQLSPGQSQIITDTFTIPVAGNYKVVVTANP